MGTSYFDHAGDFRPPPEWYDSPDAKRLLGLKYARNLYDIAAELERGEFTGPLDEHNVKERAGKAVINAFNCGFLRGIPNLGRLVAWHTDTSAKDRAELKKRTGREASALFVRCPSNLFLQIIGGHVQNAIIRPDGSFELLGPKEDDGILPAIDPVAFERGDAIGACRFLANAIGNEAATISVTETPPSVKFVPNDFQRSILRALDGRALKKQQLANDVCKGEGTLLYRKDGLKELREAGLVDHKNRLGFFRPDRPPPAV